MKTANSIILKVLLACNAVRPLYMKRGDAYGQVRVKVLIVLFLS